LNKSISKKTIQDLEFTSVLQHVSDKFDSTLSLGDFGEIQENTEYLFFN